MSDEAKKFIDAINQGILPPLDLTGEGDSSALDVSRRAIDTSSFGLQTLNEDLRKKK